MKKLTVLLSMLISSFSFANGIYSGIWQQPNTNNFIFVMQSNNELIVTTYKNYAATNIGYVFNNGQRYLLPSLDAGDIFNGSVSGSVASLTGLAAFRACNLSVTLIFQSQSSMTFSYIAAAQSSFGQAQGIDCLKIYNNEIDANGKQIPYTKVF